MKFSSEETKARQRNRELHKKMHAISHHFTLRPATCCKCGSEYQFEFGYRMLRNVHVTSGFWDVEPVYVCNDCAHSKQEACKIIFGDAE